MTDDTLTEYAAIASPTAARTPATSKPSDQRGGRYDSPRSIRRIAVRYSTAAERFVATPSSTNATSNRIDHPPCGATACGAAPGNSRKNRPKRATTNPNPIEPSPVRTQARSVRSAANRTRGSSGIGSDTFRTSLGGVCACDGRLTSRRRRDWNLS